MAIAYLQPFAIPERPSAGPWTAADLERFPEDGYQYEVWHGELVRMAPAGGRHGECEANLVTVLRRATRGLGRVYTGDTGFLLRESPDDLVSPDVAYVRVDRLPPEADRVSYVRVVPDLAVEIRSPNDKESEVRAKVALYLSAGVQRIWLVDPQQRVIEDVRRLSSGAAEATVLAADTGDVLDADDLAPGLRLPVADVFE